MMVAVIRSLTRSHTSQQKAVSYVQITRASSGQPLACKQWGYGNGYTYKTFPISFESFVKVVCTCDNDNWAGTRDITTTGFSLRAGGGACWLAVGM